MVADVDRVLYVVLFGWACWVCRGWVRHGRAVARRKLESVR